MKKLVVCNCLMFVLPLLLSCSRQRTWEPVSQRADKEIVFQEIRLDSILGTPYDLAVMDSTLLIVDLAQEQRLMLYNLYTGRCCRRLSVGQGPGEVLPLIFIDVSNSRRRVEVLQREDGICKSYPIDSLWNGIPTTPETYELRADRMAVTKEGYAHAGFTFGGIRHFRIKDSSFETIEDYSRLGVQDSMKRYIFFQGGLTYNESSSVLMTTPSFASDINFYQYRQGTWMLIGSYAVGDHRFEQLVSSDPNRGIHADDLHHCVDACASVRYFYVLYEGRDMGNNHIPPYKYILRFTADGEIDHIYRMDASISNICVSAGDTLYATMLGGDKEYTLAMADLTK